MSNNLKREDLVDLASFLAGVKGQLEDLNKKVVEGSNLRPNSIDVTKVAKEFDASRGFQPGNTTVQQPQAPYLQVNPPPAATSEQLIDNNPDQLTFSFDKKHNLEDIFNKIDDTYRRIIELENEVRELRNTLEEKKSLLK